MIVTGPTLLLHGDCVSLMRDLATGSVNFALTEPTYVARYRERSGRQVRNDDNADWLAPAFAGIHRLLKSDAFCVRFYGWHKADTERPGTRPR